MISKGHRQNVVQELTSLINKPESNRTLIPDVRFKQLQLGPELKIPNYLWLLLAMLKFSNLANVTNILFLSRYANVFLHPVTDDEAPGYHSIVFRSAADE